MAKVFTKNLLLMACRNWYFREVAVAEFEKDIIRERVVAGLENAKQKGKRLGRPVIHDCGGPQKLDNMLSSESTKRRRS